MSSHCGAGYYGASESQTFSEASGSGRDYLAEVCKDWEAEAQRSKAERNVVLRTGTHSSWVQALLTPSTCSLSCYYHRSPS